MLRLINPVERAEPFDHPDWLFEAKFDGLRAAADTVRGRLISRNGNVMQRFEEVLDLLLKGCVFVGELVVLDDAGPPSVQRSCYLGGAVRLTTPSTFWPPTALNLRALPLKQRKVRLARIGKGAEGWIALTNGVVGEGRALYVLLRTRRKRRGATKRTEAPGDCQRGPGDSRRRRGRPQPRASGLLGWGSRRIT